MYFSGIQTEGQLSSRCIRVKKSGEGLLRKIIRDAKMSREEFLKLL
jgi:hypothetical protein